MSRYVISQEPNGRNQSALEDRNRLPQVLEWRACQGGMGVYIAFLAHFRPRGKDAEGNKGKTKIYDPYPEILAGGTLKHECHAGIFDGWGCFSF